MTRAMLGWAALALLLAAPGCTMCAHNYDECGPVYDGCACANCSPGTRMNSLFAPGGYTGGAARYDSPDGGMMMTPQQGLPADGTVIQPAPAPQNVPVRPQPQPY